MAEFVQNVCAVGRPENSQKVYEPKIREFELFCELNYSHDPHYKHIVDHDKVYNFMFFQAFREKKKRGGTKAQRSTGAVFNQDEFKGLTASFFNNEAAIPYPLPKNPIMESMFAQYKAVMKSLHTEQRTRGVCNVPWDLVWTLDCSTLHKHVKERMPAIKKASYVEKIDGEFAPYAIVERYGEIEQRNSCGMTAKIAKDHGPSAAT
jgi:hypothetical protein